MALSSFPILPSTVNICRFCHSGMTHLSPDILTLFLATFLLLSVSVLPEGVTWLHGALDLGMGQKAYHISLATVLHLKMDM